MNYFKKIVIVASIAIIFAPFLTATAEIGDGANTGGVKKPATPVTLSNPLTGNSDPVTTDTINSYIGKVINAVLGVVGSIALVMFIYGGFTWMMAAGNKNQVEKGRDIIIWSVIGIVVIFMAYAMVNFVLVKVVQPLGT